MNSFSFQGLGELTLGRWTVFQPTDYCGNFRISFDLADDVSVGQLTGVSNIRCLIKVKNFTPAIYSCILLRYSTPRLCAKYLFFIALKCVVNDVSCFSIKLSEDDVCDLIDKEQSVCDLNDDLYQPVSRHVDLQINWSNVLGALDF